MGEIRTKARAFGKAVLTEIKKSVIAKKPMVKTRRIEKVIISRPKRRRVVRLRYSPMSASLLEAGRETNPWR